MEFLSWIIHFIFNAIIISFFKIYLKLQHFQFAVLEVRESRDTYCII